MSLSATTPVFVPGSARHVTERQFDLHLWRTNMRVLRSDIAQVARVVRHNHARRRVRSQAQFDRWSDIIVSVTGMGFNSQ